MWLALRTKTRLLSGMLRAHWLSVVATQLGLAAVNHEQTLRERVLVPFIKKESHAHVFPSSSATETNKEASRGAGDKFAMS
jgi:hypothetical protein